MGKLQDEIERMRRHISGDTREEIKQARLDVLQWIDVILELAKISFPKFDFAEIIDTTEKTCGVPIAVLVDLNKIRKTAEWFEEWLE